MAPDPSRAAAAPGAAASWRPVPRTRAQALPEQRDQGQGRKQQRGMGWRCRHCSTVGRMHRLLMLYLSNASLPTSNNPTNSGPCAATGLSPHEDGSLLKPRSRDTFERCTLWWCPGWFKNLLWVEPYGLMYQIRWDNNAVSWEPASHLTKASRQAFHKDHPRMPSVVKSGWTDVDQDYKPRA